MGIERRKAKGSWDMVDGGGFREFFPWGSSLAFRSAGDETRCYIQWMCVYMFEVDKKLRVKNGKRVWDVHIIPIY